MKKYRVNVNKTVYEVEIEEITASVDTAALTSSPVSEEVKTIPGQNSIKSENPLKSSDPISAKTSLEASKGPGALGDAEEVLSPMPGTILSVDVKLGQTVKAGDVLMILEAMKMENEIMCPRDGKVASINIATGSSVESGTLLCVIA